MDTAVQLLSQPHQQKDRSSIVLFLKARSSIVDLILEQEESSINFLTVALKPN
jgi:hypothetical protein